MRARASVRLAVAASGYGLLFFIFLFAIGGLDELVWSIVYPLGYILVSLLWLWLSGRWADRRSLADFGLHLNRAWWLDLGFGLLLGGLLMALIFAVELAAGWVTITETFKHGIVVGFVPAILLGLWQYVAVGIAEEVLSRGYLLRNLAEGLNLRAIGPKWALGLAYFLSSALFGLFHFFNPNASWISTLLLVAAGLFLGLGYILTGELAIPIGLHISWNFFQGKVFGFPVSGHYTGTTFIAIQQGGPTAWTGGEFGPEAGLIGLAAIVLGCALTLAWVKWRTGKLALQARLAQFDEEAPQVDTQSGEKGYSY